MLMWEFTLQAHLDDAIHGVLVSQPEVGLSWWRIAWSSCWRPVSRYPCSYPWRGHSCLGSGQWCDTALTHIGCSAPQTRSFSNSSVRDFPSLALADFPLLWKGISLPPRCPSGRASRHTRGCWWRRHGPGEGVCHHPWHDPGSPSQYPWRWQARRCWWVASWPPECCI